MQGKNIGWYWGADDGAAFVSGAHKAWLAMPAETSNARSFIDLPSFNEASSVTSIQRSTDNGNDDWYTIGGLKLQSRPTKKGIYLRSTSGRLQGKNNGRKVVVK